MTQARKKSATKTARKQVSSGARKQSVSKQCAKSKGQQNSNMFFVASMSFLAATLLFADLMMMLG